MQLHIEWDEDQREIVRSVEELDAWLDRLTQAAEVAAELFTVELHTPDDQVLALIVGGEESQVAFYSAAHNPPYLSSLGPWEDDEPIEFAHRGQYSSLPRRFFVPIAEARESMRRFFQARTLPDNICWNWWG